ncbi:MAG: hypothetical protein V7741_15160, partial [Hyphomonas sp.]
RIPETLTENDPVYWEQSRKRMSHAQERNRHKVSMDFPDRTIDYRAGSNWHAADTQTLQLNDFACQFMISKDHKCFVFIAKVIRRSRPDPTHNREVGSSSLPRTTTFPPSMDQFTVSGMSAYLIS